MTLSNKKEVLDFLRLIHRDESRYVNFARKLNNVFQQLGSIQIDELSKHWRKLSPLLKKNGYFSVNDFHSARVWKNSITGFAQGNGTNRNVHNFNALFVDLDSGRTGSSDKIKGMSATKAKNLLQAECNLTIPGYTAIVFSGRGLYVFWFLEDENGFPVHADFRTRDLYGAVQRELCNRLEFIGADCNALSATQVLRLPGTLHSTSGKRARILYLSNRRYTLEELAKRLGVDPNGSKRKYRKPKRKDTTGSKSSAGKKGFVQLNLNRMNDILALEKVRGGFKKGTRRKAIWYLVQFARDARLKRSDISRIACAMANRCRPKYHLSGCKESVDDLIERVDRRPRWYRYSNLRIVRDLKIHTEECVAADLKSIVTPEVSEERKEAKFQSAALRQKRSARILDIVQRQLLKDPQSSWKKIKRACAQHGFPISRATAYRKIKEIRAVLKARAPTGQAFKTP